MYHRVLQSKYRQEIITLVWDFQDQLTPGDYIASVALVEILVSSGDDSNPNEIIRGPPVVVGGTEVRQQVRRGIPGTIYTVTIWVDTTDGFTIEDLCYLAILPRIDFNPPIWETTQLYPIDFQDAMQGFSILIGGRLSISYVIPPEGIQGFSIPISGTLVEQVLKYHMLPEFIQGFSILVSGTLVVAAPPVIPYHIPFEAIQGFSIPVGGTLTLEVLPYRIPHEDIQGFSILTSGTLI
jgi:hypothetical protein